MIAFENRRNFFVLPIRLKTCRSIFFFVFLFFVFLRGKMFAPKIGRVSEVLPTREGPIGIGRIICPDLDSNYRKLAT